MTKDEQRRDMMAVRQAMSVGERADKSRKIATHLGLVRGVTDFAAVHVYRADLRRGEVDTEPIVDVLCRQSPLLHVTYAGSNKDAYFDDGPFDAVIVPLVAFDARLQRLGRGSGWYDRFLIRHPRATKIGVAFDIQQVERVTTESFDIALDYVVTETRILSPLSDIW